MAEKLFNETETERTTRLDKLRNDTIARDLGGLPTEKTFLEESKKTREWSC